MGKKLKPYIDYLLGGLKKYKDSGKQIFVSLDTLQAIVPRKNDLVESIYAKDPYLCAEIVFEKYQNQTFNYYKNNDEKFHNAIVSNMKPDIPACSVCKSPALEVSGKYTCSNSKCVISKSGTYSENKWSEMMDDQDDQASDNDPEENEDPVQNSDEEVEISSEENALTDKDLDSDVEESINKDQEESKEAILFLYEAGKSIDEIVKTLEKKKIAKAFVVDYLKASGLIEEIKSPLEMYDFEINVDGIVNKTSKQYDHVPTEEETKKLVSLLGVKKFDSVIVKNSKGVKMFALELKRSSPQTNIVTETPKDIEPKSIKSVDLSEEINAPADPFADLPDDI